MFYFEYWFYLKIFNNKIKTNFIFDWIKISVLDE